MSKRYNLLVALALLLAVGGIAWLWLRGGEAPTRTGRRARGPAAVAVETTPVQRITLRDIHKFSGTLQAEGQFDVGPKISGRLAQLLVDIGDAVHSGQVIARLDDDEAVQQVDQARAELGVASAGLVEARSLLSVKERQYERMRQLHQRRIASDAELETAQVEAEAQRARVQVAQAQVTQREAALRAAEVRLSYTVIRAAWSGNGTRVVGERYVNQGALLSANQPIVSIVDLHALTAVIFAAERDYPRLRIQQAATVRAEAFPGKAFAGHIVRLAPVFRESSRQARVEVRVANPGGELKPGMFATVEVELDRAEQAVAVPVAAVVTRDGRKGVFLADLVGRQARFVPVQTGIVDEGLTQIVEPALSGRVVTLGNHLLSDGVAIVATDVPGADGKRPEPKAVQ